MKKTKGFIILWLILFISVNSVVLMAGNNDDGKKKDRDDELKEVVEWAWRGKFYPFVEGTAGLAMLKHLKFQGTLPEEGLAEIKLGYSQIQEYRKYVWEMDQRYVFGSYMSDDVSKFLSPAEGDFKAKITRFGFGNRLAYGYQIGSIELLPYYQSGLVWTKIKTSEHASDLSQSDLDILKRYEGVFRFGMLTEGGVTLQLFKSVGFSSSYELAVVYPRHIFWPWLGSYLIMQIGMGMISTFGDDIVQASPTFGPIFYFLLKNGLAYGFYQGVKENMNWPFTSETPMTLETYRFGISFTF